MSNQLSSPHVPVDDTTHREPGTTVADHMIGAGSTAVLTVAAIGAPGSVLAR